MESAVSQNDEETERSSRNEGSSRSASFVYLEQTGKDNCAIACLQMIISFHEGKSSPKIIDLHSIPDERVTIHDLCQLAETLGYTTNAVSVAADDIYNIPFPLIALLTFEHYVVLWGHNGNRFHISDPKRGPGSIPKDTLFDEWLEDDTGVVILIQPDDV